MPRTVLGHGGAGGVPALVWTGGGGTDGGGLLHVAPTIAANSDLPWPNDADNDCLIREKQRLKVDRRWREMKKRR